jgi:hypothetical protein
MGDIYYELVTPSRSIYAQFNARAPRTLTVGETETFEFRYPSRDRTVSAPPDLTVSSDTTIAGGEVVEADLTTVEAGVTLTIDGTLETADLDNNGTVQVNGTLDVGAVERLRVSSDEVLLVDDLTIEDGAKVVVESGAVLQVTSVTNNGTLTGDGTVLTGSVFPLLQEYGEYAGAYATVDLLNNQLKYREQLPASAPRQSLVVGIRPAADLRDRDIPAVWGLVDDVRDARDAVLAERRIEITVRILAPFDDYNDLDAVESAFEV